MKSRDKDKTEKGLEHFYKALSIHPPRAIGAVSVWGFVDYLTEWEAYYLWSIFILYLQELWSLYEICLGSYVP